MMNQWKVRRALREDFPGIRKIEEACAEAPHWSDAVWTQVLDTTDARDPARASFVVEHGAEVVGFAVASCTCGVGNLEIVAVMPDARRHGIGRALCEAAVTWSLAQAAQTVELEVRASSAGAISLYRSLGFGEQGRRSGYYRDPIDDAVLMCAPLPAKR